MTTDPKREAFEKWARDKGYDVAYTYDTDRSRHVWLNPMTADLWSAWCVALVQPPEGEVRVDMKRLADSARDAFSRFEFEERRYTEGNGSAELRLEALNAVHFAIDSLEFAGRRSALTAPSAGHGEGWVSVGDGLPEKNTEVLVFFEGVFTIPSTGQYTASIHDHHGWCYPRENFDDASGEWPKVTHWQHLPAAPTPKDNRHE